MEVVWRVEVIWFAALLLVGGFVYLVWPIPREPRKPDRYDPEAFDEAVLPPMKHNRKWYKIG